MMCIFHFDFEIYFRCLKVKEGNELGSRGAAEEGAEVGGEVEGRRGGEGDVARKHFPTGDGFRSMDYGLGVDFPACKGTTQEKMI